MMELLLTYDTPQTDKLTHEATKKLIQKIQSGSDDAQECIDTLFYYNEKLIWFFVQKYSSSMKYNKEDLFQTAAETFTYSLYKFDTTKNITLTSYLGKAIRNKLTANLYQSYDLKIPNNLIHLSLKIKDSELVYSSVDDIAKHPDFNNISHNAIQQALDFIKTGSGKALSTDDKLDKNENVSSSYGDMIEGDLNKDWENDLEIKDLVEQLNNKKEKRYIKLYYLHGIPQKEIADKEMKANSNVCNSIKNGLKKLKNIVEGRDQMEGIEVCNFAFKQKTI